MKEYKEKINYPMKKRAYLSTEGIPVKSGAHWKRKLCRKFHIPASCENIAYFQEREQT